MTKKEKSLNPKTISQVGSILSDLSEKSIQEALEMYEINDDVPKKDREGGKIETIYVCDINDRDNIIAIEAEWEAEWYGEWSMRCFMLCYPKLISTKKLEHKYSISDVCEYEEGNIRGDFTIKIEIPNI
jgi:hypothetical protein